MNDRYHDDILNVLRRLVLSQGYSEGGDLWVGPAIGEIAELLGCSRDEIAALYIPADDTSTPGGAP